MRFTLSNQTGDNLLCQFGDSERMTNQQVLLVLPFSESNQFSPKCSKLLFSKLPQDGTTKKLGFTTEACSVPIKPCVASWRRWERVTVQGDVPWTVYRNRISRKRHVLIVFPRRDTSCFLASIPDAAPLSSLMLPGSHETMAFYGWPISQCQSQPLDVQLHAGIRVIDVRLSIIDGRLIAYHGIFPEITPFADILVMLYEFLTEPTTASETVVVSIKQEDSDTQLFPILVRDEIAASRGGLEMWHLENRIPSLGEVRGKAVMFSRFGSDGWEGDTNGVHPPIWPDSAKDGFEWECGRTLVRVQDWYDIWSIFSISKKASLSTEILVQSEDTPMPTLAISFMSAASIPLALPPMVALGFGWPRWGLGFEGVNDRVGKWLLDQLSPGDAKRWQLAGAEKWGEEESRIRGWTLMDYYGDPISADVVPLLVECNFRGRRAGEDGSESSQVC